MSPSVAQMGNYVVRDWDPSPSDAGAGPVQRWILADLRIHLNQPGRVRVVAQERYTGRLVCSCDAVPCEHVTAIKLLLKTRLQPFPMASL